jgi:hypothetical protein
MNYTFGNGGWKDFFTMCEAALRGGYSSRGCGPSRDVMYEGGVETGTPGVMTLGEIDEKAFADAIGGGRVRVVGMRRGPMMPWNGSPVGKTYSSNDLRFQMLDEGGIAYDQNVMGWRTTPVVDSRGRMRIAVSPIVEGADGRPRTFNALYLETVSDVDAPRLGVDAGSRSATLGVE